MLASGTVSIPSSTGSSTVLTVTGAHTLAYAQMFQDYLDNAIANGSLKISLGQPVSARSISFAAAAVGKVNEAVVSSDENAGVGIGTSSTVPGGYQGVFDNVNGPTTVVGSGSDLTALFAGLGGAGTFVDHGGDNTIIFVNGNNVYLGDTIDSATSDTITGGTGFDTITTGIGRADVYAGVGQSIITTNDAVPVVGNDWNSNFNSYIYVEDGGQSTVNANGVKDAVIVSQPGQVINAGLSATDYTDIVLLAGAGGTGNNIINADAATVAVFDSSNGDSIYGGTGLLMFMGEPDVSASVFGASGITHMFGANGDSISFYGSDTTGTNIFVAGAGNETLNGAGATANLALFANSDRDSVIGSAASASLVGGAGNDTLVSAEGNSTLVGGLGNNLFVIAAPTDGIGGNVVLSDFAASAGNLIVFANYSQSTIDAALSGAHTVTGAGGETDSVIKFADNTTVTVVGISSLTGHTFGG